MGGLVVLAGDPARIAGLRATESKAELACLVVRHRRGGPVVALIRVARPPRVRTHPMRGRERRHTRTTNRRFARLEPFPYMLLYAIVRESETIVLAVAHDRRRSGYWLSRAEGLE